MEGQPRIFRTRGGLAGIPVSAGAPRTRAQAVSGFPQICAENLCCFLP